MKDFLERFWPLRLRHYTCSAISKHITLEIIKLHVEPFKKILHLCSLEIHLSLVVICIFNFAIKFFEAFSITCLFCGYDGVFVTWVKFSLPECV